LALTDDVVNTRFLFPPDKFQVTLSDGENQALRQHARWEADDGADANIRGFFDMDSEPSSGVSFRRGNKRSTTRNEPTGNLAQALMDLDDKRNEIVAELTRLTVLQAQMEKQADKRTKKLLKNRHPIE